MKQRQVLPTRMILGTGRVTIILTDKGEVAVHKML